MEAAIASFSNFGHQRHCNEIMVFCRGHKMSPDFKKNVVGKIILDQFADCKLCIVIYYKFTVHKLVQNYV